MKKGCTISILVFLAIAFAGALFWLYQKNAQPPVVYETEKPEIRSISKSTVATGNINPKEEVLIKPNISGIIDEVYVEAGDYIKNGDLIAKIKVVPNVSNLNSANNQIQSAKIDLENQKRIYERQKTLFSKGVISANDYDAAETAYKLAQQTYRASQQSAEIIRTGTTSGMTNVAQTLIRSTVSGMVLDVPVKKGNQVIEANNFNEGTTIASLADVGNMIFEGKIDESEVGKLKLGLPLEISVGAIENEKFNAVLDYIAPKGVNENGAMQFPIKGTLENKESTFIRSGLSANASIIIAKVTNVLTLKEGLVQYDEKTKKSFVEVMVSDQKFERRYVELGVSDGIYVEIKKGITKNDKIKVWNQVKK
ncbi:efflux RND transporter periplasmic adaptor subunit [Flavobacterium sp. xlx-214]|uniref:efflux RND transporter periplasmic adaptor subunit n=1 Tax=unclassified Flavobacterium TaxID=196869 RepID=UPI0013D66E2C|nr:MULTISPECIES: efflux RND transporter periplasmic adaptor subunit [unclassified Flavobacterium]MBA5792218.1 efflux RND transporter periplasmic adaptor subunit [Flavobacterium sp. xlx-221]QMI84460.1 efflux RND transporter periplasmic adaptor subunit [Flavobacterium sp. xlx-214]